MINLTLDPVANRGSVVEMNRGCCRDGAVMMTTSKEKEKLLCTCIYILDLGEQAVRSFAREIKQACWVHLLSPFLPVIVRNAPIAKKPWG